MFSENQNNRCVEVLCEHFVVCVCMCVWCRRWRKCESTVFLPLAFLGSSELHEEIRICLLSCDMFAGKKLREDLCDVSADHLEIRSPGCYRRGRLRSVNALMSSRPTCFTFSVDGFHFCRA